MACSGPIGRGRSHLGRRASAHGPPARAAASRSGPGRPPSAAPAGSSCSCRTSVPVLSSGSNVMSGAGAGESAPAYISISSWSPDEAGMARVEGLGVAASRAEEDHLLRHLRVVGVGAVTVPRDARGRPVDANARHRLLDVAGVLANEGAGRAHTDSRGRPSTPRAPGPCSWPGTGSTMSSAGTPRSIASKTWSISRWRSVDGSTTSRASTFSWIGSHGRDLNDLVLLAQAR